MVDKTTLRLFGDMPREVGVKRRHCASIHHFINWIEENNGINDCYVSVYPKDGTIDKIYYDFDSKTNIAKAVNEAKKFYRGLTSSFNVIPVFSGEKGVNLHVLLKAKKYNVRVTKRKLMLSNAALYLLDEVFGHNEKTRIIRVNTADPTCVGDIRRICRVPDTLRPPENLSYCTYLPPEWVDWSVEDIVLHAKSRHSYDYKLDNERLPTLDMFPSDVDLKLKGQRDEEKERSTKGRRIRTTDEGKFLEKLLRPCLYKRIIGKNPSHDVRVATTIDLLQFFSDREILNIYKGLGWKDWDSDTTEYQIQSCKGLIPYSCSKLIRKGIPDQCCVG